MTIQETIKADLTAAMKAGEKVRVTALRLVLAELQKDEKEGKGDELAVLRRERKRRIEAAEQFEDAGRDDLAGPERTEAEMIAAYLPAELGDDELEAIVEKAVSDSGASTAADIGQAMKSVMQAVDGRADGKRVNALVREVLGA
jgi:hypothetical protein